MRKSKDTDGPEPGAVASKYLKGTLLVTLTVEQFVELQASLQQPVAANDAADELLSRNAIAKRLGCSVAQIDKFRKDGMPCTKFGQVPRFVERKCRAWHDDQKWKKKP